MKTNSKITNYLEVSFKSISKNEALSRVIIAGFVMPLNPTIEQLNDIKTSVSEAVTNSIIHGYENSKENLVTMQAFIEGNVLTIKIKDKGVGIKNIQMAREPLYSSKPDLERSGLGFTIMESFMDTLEVESEYQKGTTVTMTKIIESDGADTYDE